MNKAAHAGWLAAGIVAAGASAEIVHFANPSPGEPGHHDWRWPGFFQRSWLDITRSPADQAGVSSGSAVAQTRPALGHPEEANRLDGGAEVAIHVDAMFEGYTRAFDLGDPVVGADFGTISTLFYWNFEDPGAIPPWGASLFPEGSRRYIGVRTVDGRYGWIEVERTGGNVAAFAWAYETSPGVPILAGQVPAPGGAMVLALASLSAFRRRRP